LDACTAHYTEDFITDNEVAVAKVKLPDIATGGSVRCATNQYAHPEIMEFLNIPVRLLVP